MKKSFRLKMMRGLNKLYKFISDPYTFVGLGVLIAIWFGVGFPLHFNEFWYRTLHLFELLITLLFVVIIEYTQRAETEAMQEKLNELIKKLPQTDSRLAELEKEYKGEKRDKK